MITKYTTFQHGLWIPEERWTLNEEESVTTTKFGDGYEQRMAVGINNRPKSFDLTYTGDIQTILNLKQFLTDYGRKGFVWRSPIEIDSENIATERYVCLKTVMTRPDSAVVSLKVTFKQVFEK